MINKLSKIGSAALVGVAHVEHALNKYENPYKLPLNWKWTRLFDIGLINPRNEAKDDMAASFIPMTLISETYSIPISSERRLWGEIKSGFTHFAEEDVVLVKITPCFQNGKSAVMRNLLNGFGAGLPQDDRTWTF